MEVDIDAVGEQLRILQDQYKEKSKEYDHLYEKFNQTSQVQQHPNHFQSVVFLVKSKTFALPQHSLDSKAWTVQVKICFLSSPGPAKQADSHRGFQ